MKWVWRILVFIFGMLIACQASAADDEWDCPVCGRTDNLYSFCGICGTERPALSLFEENDLEFDSNSMTVVTFGRYRQDDSTDVEQPIRWYVLKQINNNKNKNQILLLSEYGLDVQRYHKGWNFTAWEKCDLYDWLNHDFYQAAFTENEQSCIIPITQSKTSKAESGLNDKEKADNYVFLLTTSDVNSNNIPKTCIPTAYAIMQGAFTQPSESKGRETCWWWLRTWDSVEGKTELTSSGPVIVDSEGKQQTIGAASEHIVVRPACWVDLKKIEQLMAIETRSD